MNFVTLVEETSAGLVENVGFGMICDVDGQLETVNHADYPFYHSASKDGCGVPVFEIPLKNMANTAEVGTVNVKFSLIPSEIRERSFYD